MDNFIDIQSQLLLTREASMASMSLGIGLTLLRKYDFAQPGFFFTSLYSITTGIERLLKLILIYDHRLNNNNRLPDNKYLKGFGHQLKPLYRKAIEINRQHQIKNDDSFYFKDDIYDKIVTFLSDFAMQSRYYNLDALTGRQQSSNIEPLTRWNDEINSLILERHYKPKEKDIKGLKMLSNFMEDFSLVMHTDESGRAINTVKDLLISGDAVTTKQKYSMYYIYVAIRFIAELFISLEYCGNFFPCLREFFILFNNNSKTEILRKKSWNPNPPYKF
jgi:hypothetical protein